MDISFYTATTCAQQQQRRLDVHGNNIANVNTYGFKARVPSFSSLITGNVVGIDEPLARGVGSKLEEAEPDMRTTGIGETGRMMDYAIKGSGFFAVLNPANDQITYTRDGSFIMSRTGDTWYLTDGLGRYVLDQNQEKIEVDPNDRDVLQPVGVFDFINYNGIRSVDASSFAPVEKNGAVMPGEGELLQGYLELSNTDLANEFAKVIEAQRSFSYMLKMITTSDEITSTVNGLR